jgi:hypothetical protein
MSIQIYVSCKLKLIWIFLKATLRQEMVRWTKNASHVNGPLDKKSRISQKWSVEQKNASHGNGPLDRKTRISRKWSVGQKETHLTEMVRWTKRTASQGNGPLDKKNRISGKWPVGQKETHLTEMVRWTKKTLISRKSATFTVSFMSNIYHDTNKINCWRFSQNVVSVCDEELVFVSAYH